MEELADHVGTYDVPNDVCSLGEARFGGVKAGRRSVRDRDPFRGGSGLLGVGLGAVRSGLRAAGVELRVAGEPAPWTLKRSGSAALTLRDQIGARVPRF
jgi:hypothetical protein